MKIEMNIGKRHLWAMIAVIVVLFSVTLAIAKTTTPAYTDDKPFHDDLYADVIVGKSANLVTVDDDMKVTGKIRGEMDCRVVENTGPGPSYVSVAQCDADEWLMAGGGACENGFGSVCPSTCACSPSSPNQQWMGFVTDSHPFGSNGWMVDCYTPSGSDTCSKAWALCCKKS